MKLYEVSTISTGRANVNRDLGIIHGVKILGRESKNGRTYSEKALKEAAQKYEGVDVNVNHPDRSKPHAERRIEDGIGWLESVTVKPDGVYGDLHYLKEHPSSGLLAEAAERKSNRFGLSHNAQGTVGRKDGKNVVESIDRVLSVDLVQNPATNAGLFESTQLTIREVLEQHAPEALVRLTEDGALLPPDSLDEPMPPQQTEDGMDGKASAKAALVQLLTAVVEMPGDIKAIAVQLIDVCQKIIAGQPEPVDQNADAENPEEEQAPSEEPDPNNPAAAADKSADPQAGGSANSNPFVKKKENDMAESTKKSVEERLALLEAENKQLKEDAELVRLEKHCTKLLQEAKREVTGPRLTALARMDDDPARLQLIEEWAVVAEPEPTVPRKQKPTFNYPLREQTDECHAFAKTHEEFVASLR